MIDTIRFKIPLSPEAYKTIKAQSIQIIKKNNADGRIYFNVISSNINVGSYSRKINLFIYEESNVYLEFSLPKYYFGHNIYLIYPTQLNEILVKFYFDLLQFFPDFPDYKTWEIERIDLCYAWKYENECIAEAVLAILRSYKYPRKKLATYDTSLMAVGSSYSVKFYLKHPEFYKHDFKVLSQQPNYTDYAYELLNISEGVLRFEVTMRKTALKRYFPPLNKKTITVESFNCDKIPEVLESIFTRFIKGSQPNFMTPTEVFEQLHTLFSNTKAMNLWQFYCIYHSDDPNSRDILSKFYSRKTIWKNLKDLSYAKIGLPRKDLNVDISLSIPSEYVINPEISQTSAS